MNPVNLGKPGTWQKAKTHRSKTSVFLSTTLLGNVPVFRSSTCPIPLFLSISPPTVNEAKNVTAWFLGKKSREAGVVTNSPSTARASGLSVQRNPPRQDSAWIDLRLRVACPTNGVAIRSQGSKIFIVPLLSLVTRKLKLRIELAVGQKSTI